ncbi:hypothetical protein HDV57DRAFT_241918 [Trichoderma longibrachiatum]|uniref:Uncharacterized protein n=1 Tax=Trichoderma longibrachiatum ATCC 18648 TaxID=983965 RepID=A0A2T4BZV4_TRILO|nr:hypothetical protein M440DRAFT_1403357 [Trichoderma longibrachiatum ATCC 18648]
MPVKYIFTESAPSQTTYFRSGRGGAGNTFRTSALPSTATSTASTTTTTATSSSQPRHLPNQRFFSGIGGAGNVHPADELQSALLSSLESMGPLGGGNPERGHVGRGGAGNVYGGGARRKTSDAGSSVSSAASVASSVSEKAKAWASRVGGAFARK